VRHAMRWGGGGGWRGNSQHNDHAQAPPEGDDAGVAAPIVPVDDEAPPSAAGAATAVAAGVHGLLRQSVTALLAHAGYDGTPTPSSSLGRPVRTPTPRDGWRWAAAEAHALQTLTEVATAFFDSFGRTSRAYADGWGGRMPAAVRAVSAPVRGAPSALTTIWSGRTFCRCRSGPRAWRLQQRPPAMSRTGAVVYAALSGSCAPPCGPRTHHSARAPNALGLTAPRPLPLATRPPLHRRSNSPSSRRRMCVCAAGPTWRDPPNESGALGRWGARRRCS
jgi:hypothetical protein